MGQYYKGQHKAHINTSEFGTKGLHKGTYSCGFKYHLMLLTLDFVVYKCRAWYGHFLHGESAKDSVDDQSQCLKNKLEKKSHKILMFLLPSFWCPLTIPCHTDVCAYKSMLFHIRKQFTQTNLNENGENFMYIIFIWIGLLVSS